MLCYVSLAVPTFGMELSAQFDAQMQPASTVVLKCIQAVENRGGRDCVCFLAHLSHSLTRSLTRSPTHSLTHSLTHSPLTHSPTHPPTHSLTHPLIHSLTHSLTYMYMYILHVYNQEHMSRRRRQGASNHVERHLHLHAFSAFRIRTVLDYGEYPLWSRCCDSYT